MPLELNNSKGAVFWAYISPHHDTSKVVTEWSITISQGRWSGAITSAHPTRQLQTPELSGLFNLEVTASGPGFPETTLKPQSGVLKGIGCNANCASMVGIVALAGGGGAEYWTTWDAMCNGT